MADIKMESDALDEVISGLERISSDFNSLHDDVWNNKGVWGHRSIEACMENFEWNWTDHRKEIVKSVDGLGDKAKKIRDGFADTEKQLEDVQNKD